MILLLIKNKFFCFESFWPRERKPKYEDVYPLIKKENGHFCLLEGKKKKKFLGEGNVYPNISTREPTFPRKS
jgi:hypothetical protein